MKTILSLIALAMVAVLSGCGSSPTYVIVPEAKPETRSTPRTPIKYSGGSSTYSSSSPEGFRAVGPSN